MKGMWITFRKEIRSIFRDRKTLITLLVFPILIPMMIFLYAYMYEGQLEENDYMIGVNYEPNSTEISFLDEANLKVKVYSDKKKMEDAYNNGEIFGYIDYNDNEKKYLVYTNEDSEEGMYVSGYITAYLDSYNNYLARLYMIGENVDVDKAYNNFSYEIIDLEGENFILLLMFTVSFTYIVMSIVMATTNMATAATAVERENGTLETILTFPIRIRDLILGKYLATVLMGVFSSVIGLILTVGSLAIATSNFSVFEGIVYNISVSSILLSMLVVIIASFFIAGLAILVTSFAKSYKEAQSISSVLNMLTVVPMLISLLGMEIKKWYYLIPIFNYTQLLLDIFSNSIDVFSVLMVVLSSFILVFLVIYLILYNYKTEKVLFGK